MDKIASLQKESQLPWQYRAYAPVVRALSALGRYTVCGRHPFLVLRTFLNRGMFRTVLTKRAQVAVRTKQGFIIIAPLYDQGAASILFQREYSPVETEVLSRLLPYSSSFTDIGCNLGYFTLLAKTLTGPDYPVVSVDPNRELCALVSESVRANKYTGVSIHNAAVSEQAGKLYFRVDPRLSTSGSVTLSATGADDGFFMEIQAMTLSSLVPLSSTSSSPKLPLIKIDVEGHEIEALRGGQPVIENGAIVLCEAWRETGVLLEEFAARYGYQLLNHSGHLLARGETRRHRRSDVILVPAGLQKTITAALVE